ncbi:germination protein GerB [Paenibacillus sp. J53TS2]|uniref:GerAB/ArcD/ProY family transporter n=1 Tax=Paenibacillus sp. J53TS2 TaxID=2807197 RepID=UPI001AFF56ED|nr:GerAB/ArcD/ProY family transporter [Paenibacillus sp. J53TS2]GIP49118.1 germination protein GerB [Paenibacillus sp. J53TS2]
MSGTVKESNQVSGYLVWFLIHGVQTGIGMLNFQQKIVDGAEQDAWVSVLFVGACMHLLIWMLFRLMRMAEEGDIFSLHRQLFGPIVGNGLSGMLFFYCVLICTGQIRPYGEIIHVWVFPDAPLWQISIILLAVAGYIVSGGFRVVAGICLLCVVIPSLVLPSLYFPLKIAHWLNFFPLWNHGLGDYAKSAVQSIYIFLGPEFLLFYYPFIKNNAKAQRWAHLAVAHTTLLYMTILVTTISYFNIRQLKHTLWPTLILSKIIRFAFLERFDYIYIFNWLLVIFPICCMSIWAAVRILTRTLKISRKWALGTTTFVIIGMVLSMRTPVSIERMEHVISLVGGAFTFGYLPLLFLVALGREALKRRRSARSS